MQQINKQFPYDRLSKDYAAIVNGVILGYFDKEIEAKIAADRYVFEMLSIQTQPTPPKTPVSSCVCGCPVAEDDFSIHYCRQAHNFVLFVNGVRVEQDFNSYAEADDYYIASLSEKKLAA